MQLSPVVVQYDITRKTVGLPQHLFKFHIVFVLVHFVYSELLCHGKVMSVV